MEFTVEEKTFLKNLLSQLTLNPSSKDALKTVELVQGIIGKLSEVPNV